MKNNFAVRQNFLQKLGFFWLMACLGIFTAKPAHAEFDMECYLKGDCTRSSGRGAGGAGPSTGGRVRINPSAVPTESGFGIEGIFFKDSIDVALVRGLGRVGAAISPSNSEDTFFGPPAAFETPEEFLDRHIELKKYPSQKYTLATAVSLIDKKGSDLGAYSLKLGIMGKYNKYTKNISPGGGLTGTLGPLTFGGSYYKDETQAQGNLEESLRPPAFLYNVRTYNVGIFLSSLILDYSYLELKEEKQEEVLARVNLYTASLMWKRFIFTGSKRVEKSFRPRFVKDTQSLEYHEIQDSYFGGVQYAPNKYILVGALYNYYMLDEFSLMATVFF